MYDGIDVPELFRAFRLACQVAGVLAVVALVGGAALGALVAGIAFVIGLAIGAANNLALQRASVRVGVRGKRRSAFDTLGRLGVVTLVVVGIIWLLGRPGFGAVIGVALFQFLMLLAVSRVLWRQLRSERSA